MIDIWKALIEHVLSWPVTAVFLGLMFRKPIRALLRRIHKLKVKAPGLELEGEARKQLEANSTPRKDLLTAPPDTQLQLPLDADLAERRRAVEAFGGDNPILMENIQGIKEALTALGYSLADAGTTELLIRHLAVTQLLQRVETLYRLIYGSQLDAMFAMNQQGPQPESVIRPFYDRVRKRSPRFYADYSFDQWIGFLLQHQLVIFTGERYGITVLGREFVSVLVGQGFPRKTH